MNTSLSCFQLLRIGKVAILNVQGVGLPTLLHAIWPHAKKPRPIAQPVPLARVKSFRGTILVPDPDADGLVPSEVSSVFLDVRSADLAAGRVFLTEASMQILSKMKDEVLVHCKTFANVGGCQNDPRCSCSGG